jgi:hypothetical protein
VGEYVCEQQVAAQLFEAVISETIRKLSATTRMAASS